MPSDPVDACEAALVEFRLAAENDTSLISLPSFRKLDALLSATERLIAECQRALDEGDWA